MSDNKEIALTILEQLGGNRFIAMTGAKNLAYSADGLTFKIGRNPGKVTHVKIAYDRVSDLYTMVFYQCRKHDLKTIKELSGVYFDMLQSIFAETTGLKTHL